MSLPYINQATLVLLLTSCTFQSFSSETSYSHNLTYNQSRYEEEYEVDDFVLTFRPSATNRSYQLGIGKRWSIGLSEYYSYGDIEESMAIPLLPDRQANLTASHEIYSRTASLNYYFDTWWLGGAYITSVDEQEVLFRSPNKAFEVLEDSQYTTYSLSSGISHYVGDLVLGGQTYLDVQLTDYESSIRHAEGTVDLRNVLSQTTEKDAQGVIGTIVTSIGYEFYGEKWLIYPELSISHTRTLDGTVNQYQQSSSRWVGTDQTNTFNDEGESIDDAEANPVTSWTASNYIYWDGWSARFSRQHVLGQPYEQDTFSVSLGWQYQH